MSDFRDLYTIKIDRIEDLFKYLSNTSNELTLWRGQSNTDWFITSSFLRFYENCVDKNLLITSIGQVEQKKEFSLNENYFNLSIELIESLQKKLIDKGYKFSFKQTLYLGQHYGLPTNLIDFTMNPYIALFFAFDYEKESKIGYASIFKTHPFKFYRMIEYGAKRQKFICIADLYEEFTSLKKDDRNFKFPKIEFKDIRMNIRIQNQQGAFIYFPSSIPYDVIMYRIKEQQLGLEKKIDINIKLKKVKLLYSLGISKESMYPTQNISSLEKFETDLGNIIKNIKKKSNVI